MQVQIKAGQFFYHLVQNTLSTNIISRLTSTVKQHTHTKVPQNVTKLIDISQSCIIDWHHSKFVKSTEKSFYHS